MNSTKFLEVRMMISLQCQKFRSGPTTDFVEQKSRKQNSNVNPGKKAPKLKKLAKNWYLRSPKRDPPDLACPVDASADCGLCDFHFENNKFVQEIVMENNAVKQFRIWKISRHAWSGAQKPSKRFRIQCFLVKSFSNSSPYYLQER